MDLKFSFGGASPDHSHDGHGEAPSGIPLPFSVAPASTSSVLEVHVRVTDAQVIAEALSGDGVTYGRAELDEADRDPLALARAVRSVTARVVAELDGPLAEAVTGLVLRLGGREVPVIEALDFPVTPAEASATGAAGPGPLATGPAGPPVALPATAVPPGTEPGAESGVTPGAASGDARPAVAVTSEPFQRRTGVVSGTPVHIG